MIGVRAAGPGRLRMRRAASSPSMPGICTSIRIRSKPRAAVVTPSRPSSAVSTWRPAARGSAGDQAVGGVVLDHQDLQALKQAVGHLGLGRAGLGRRRGDGQQEGRAGALARGEADLAAHHLGQAPGDGQAQARAAEPAGGAGVGLLEAFEQPRLASAAMPTPVSITSKATRGPARLPPRPRGEPAGSPNRPG
jgi:hypothetical protein